MVEWQELLGLLHAGYLHDAAAQRAGLNIGYSNGYSEIFTDGDPDYRNNALFVYYGITLP